MRLSAYVLCAAVALGGVDPALAQERPTIGVAFGGGSARGIAHVGVIKWFEQHHIPIDVTAGTSMGGLIGGSFATGMDAAELEAMLDGLDWDQIFGFSNFAFKNIRRKADARAYPSRLEFGMKRGIVSPTALNNGQQVNLLITRITAPYFAAATFDSLPTPLRVVAVDLRTATPVVIDRGSLATALRATMSLPGVFPPVEVGNQILVDGGAMNNVPADVVRDMGATVVIAVNVGDLDDQEDIDYSILGLAGATIDAMMRASTRRALSSADVVINVPLKEFGSLDWRRSRELIDAGYQAAESMREELLPFAVDEAAWNQWLARRRAARIDSLPQPAFVRFEGVERADERRMSQLLAGHVGRPLDVASLEVDPQELSGLDRYETIEWQLGADPSGELGLTIVARAKPYAPPFLMLGLNLENTTSDQFQLSLTARYLRFDVLGSGSELRLDATVGGQPGVAMALYRPLAGNAFVVPYAGVGNRDLNLIADGVIVARYGRTVSKVGADLGLNLGRDSDLRLGASVGHLDAHVIVGDPGLPEVTGKETVAHLAWRFDNQDSTVVPSRGVNAGVSFEYTIDGPNLTAGADPLLTQRSSVNLPRLFGEANKFWSPGDRSRLFVLGAAGTSFDRRPLRLDQFALGRPLHMGAYGVDELLGDHTLLTNLRYAAGDDLGVQTMISDALAIFPEDPVATAYARGGTPVANAAAGVEAIFARGVELTNQSRHLEAAVAYRLAVRISEQPDGQGWAKAADAWNNLGFSLAAAGLFQEAVPALGRALALRPGFELAANNLAWAQGEVAASY